MDESTHIIFSGVCFVKKTKYKKRPSFVSKLSPRLAWKKRELTLRKDGRVVISSLEGEKIKVGFLSWFPTFPFNNN